MRTLSDTLLKRYATIAAILFCVPPQALSQEDEDQANAEDEPVEEDVVYAIRRGDPIDLDARYAEQLRKRVMADYFEQQRLMEREQWRSSLDTAVKSPSRIRWGYDPGAELRMRRETDLMSLPFETTRAATILRIEF